MHEGDAELLRAWAMGDADAGRRLFARHFASLHRFFRGKLPEHADDLTQSTLLRSVGSVDRLHDDTSFRAYLFSIARHELYDHFRRRRAGVELDPATDCIDDLTPSPSAALVEKTERRVLLEALRRVPLDAQVLLELHYWEGMTSDDLSGVVGVPASTVRSRLARARTLLQQRLAELTQGTPLHSTVDDIDGWADRIRSYARQDGDD